MSASVFIVKARLRSILLWVALSVLWAAFALAGPFLLATMSDHRSTSYGKAILRDYVSIFRLHEAPQTLAAPWFTEGLLFAALGTLAVILITMLLDRQAYSTRALRWCVGTIPCLFAWSCGVVFCTWLASRLPQDNDLGMWVVMGLWFIATPFFSFRRDVIACDRPPLFWLPGWPGTPAIALFVIAVAAWLGADFLPTGLDSPTIPKTLSWTWAIVSSLMSWALGLMLMSYVLLSWLQ